MNNSWRPFDSNDKLFLWLMHRFAQRFAERAVLKGGMALRLLSSDRATVDIDYVMVPYDSKREIADEVRDVLSELDDARVRWQMHSKMMRGHVQIDDADVIVEISVASTCATVATTTAELARPLNRLAQAVQMMAPGESLAHKLAAWNERRLLRDLYDAAFLLSVHPDGPDIEVLKRRLSQVSSRLPALRRIRSMTLDEFAQALQQAAKEIDNESVQASLAGLVPAQKLEGAALPLRSAIAQLAQQLASQT